MQKCKRSIQRNRDERVASNTDIDNPAYWTSVVAKALAFLCLHQADLRKESIATQAKFLTGLGLSNTDAAGILGTTSETVRVGIAQLDKKGRGKRGKKTKK
jgi:hypothetical protein